MEQYTAGDARLKMREILSAVEHEGQVEITRWNIPIARVVSVEWAQQIDDLLTDLEALKEWRDKARALRRATDMGEKK